MQKLTGIPGAAAGVLQYADHIMEALLAVFAARPGGGVHEEGMLAAGALTYACGRQFSKYMEAFFPVLERGLSRYQVHGEVGVGGGGTCSGVPSAAASSAGGRHAPVEAGPQPTQGCAPRDAPLTLPAPPPAPVRPPAPQEYAVCQVCVGVLGDVCRAIEEQVFPYCDRVMLLLLHNLQSGDVHRSIKPAILSAFGDIALAVGDKFEVRWYCGGYCCGRVGQCGGACV